MPYLTNAGKFLVDILFGAAALLFVLRVLLQWVGVNFRNPICQIVYRLTNPVLTPLRRVLKPWRRIDTAAALFAGLVMLVKAAVVLILLRLPPAPMVVLILGAAELIGLVLMLYFWMILLRVIMSWVGGRNDHPATPLLTQLTTPVLRPIQRLLPAMGGFDLSPLVASLMILLARMLLVDPLRDLALLMAIH